MTLRSEWAWAASVARCSVSGTWALNPAQTVISVSRDGDTESWNLLNLGKTEFTAEYPIEEGGVTYTFKAVYVKK